MLNLLKRAAGSVRHRFRHMSLLARRRRSAHHVPMIPEPPVWQFPAGITIKEVGETGVRLVDNFCTAEEAAAIIEIGRQTVSPSTVIGPDSDSMLHEHRTSSDTFVSLNKADPLILDMVYRASALLGLPMSHSEAVSLTRYRTNEHYKAHLDHDGSLNADRLYTVLLYLNDLTAEEGGGTMFEKLNMVTQPVCGRAMLWVNSDRNRKALQETLHASLPVTGDDTEKWVAQMWFRTYEYSVEARPVERADNRPGTPLREGASLPNGIFIREGE